jgi:hypothetical protein
VDRRLTTGEALLTALGGVEACKQGLHPLVREMGAESPDAFGGAVILAAKLAEEVDRLGGDSAGLLQRVYARALELAPS